MSVVHKPDCELIKHRQQVKGKGTGAVLDLKLTKLGAFGEPQDQGYASERSPEEEHPPTLPGQAFPTVTPGESIGFCFYPFFLYIYTGVEWYIIEGGTIENAEASKSRIGNSIETGKYFYVPFGKIIIEFQWKEMTFQRVVRSILLLSLMLFFLFFFHPTLSSLLSKTCLLSQHSRWGFFRHS